MNTKDLKKYISYSDSLNENIALKHLEVQIWKEYTINTNNQESLFDYNSSFYTTNTNSYYDEYIKKKKTNNIIMNEDLRLSDEDIIHDLNECYTHGDIHIRVFDTSLFIGNIKFSKNDKVIVKEDEEYTGTITSIDSYMIVVKGRDNKRNRIQIDDIRNKIIEIEKYLKNVY